MVLEHDDKKKKEVKARLDKNKTIRDSQRKSRSQKNTEKEKERLRVTSSLLNDLVEASNTHDAPPYVKPLIDLLENHGGNIIRYIKIIRQTIFSKII